MDREHQDFVNLLRRIEVQYGKAGWNANVLPGLYALFRLSPTRLKPIKLNIDPTIWNMGTPGDVLVGISKACPEIQGYMAKVFQLGEQVGYTWTGMALAMEAWMVQTGPGDGAAEVEKVLAMADKRQIHQHPRRESIRVVYGITRAQDRAMVMRLEREPEGVRIEDDANFPGGIQEGLATLVATFDGLLG